MGGDFIKEYEEERVKPFSEAWASVPEAAHAGWRSYASQRSVRAVAVAPKTQRVWAATWGGVISWNQRGGDLSYLRFGSEHGLAGGPAACVCLDAEERAWVGHDGGGLSVYDGGAWRVSGSPPPEPVRALCPAAGGGVWAATRAAVYRVESPDAPAVMFAGGRQATSNALALLDDDGGPLLGNAWGLYRLRGGEETEPVAPEEITHCTSLARDARGAVWAGTPSGVYALAGDGQAPRLAWPGRGTRALAAGRDGLWVLTDSGLMLLVGGEARVVNTAGSAAMHSLASHRDESYVIAGTDELLARVTYVGGESFYLDAPLTADQHDRLNNLCFAGVPQGADGKVLVATGGGFATLGRDDPPGLQTARGAVWAVCLTSGAEGGGGYCALTWSRQVIVSGRPARGLGGLPLALAAGVDGFAHVVTSEGLWRVGAAETQRIAGRPPERVRGLAQTPDGVWRLGTAAGVFRLRGDEWVLAGEQPGPGSAEVFHVAAAHGSFWAATDAGLWAARGESWERHPAAGQDGALTLRVGAVAPASAGGALWLARSDGVLRYDPRGRRVERIYRPADSGLVSARVNSLLEHDGALWVFTDDGVSSLNLRDEVRADGRDD